MVLSPGQILAYVEQAGFTGDAARTMAAIVLAESGGDTQAYNPEKAAGTKSGQGSYGLAQIYLTAHPQYDPTQLYDPLYNLEAAAQVFQAAGNSFTPWSTYNLGSYKNYLGYIPMTAAQATTNQIPQTATAQTSFAPAAASNLIALLIPQAVPVQTQPTQPFNLWQTLGIDPTSIGFTMAGTILVIIGLMALFYVTVRGVTPVVEGATRTAAKVAALAA